MLDLLTTIGDRLVGLPRDAFGDRLDTGLGIVAATYTSIVALCFVIGALRSVWELTKAIDVRFNKAKLDAYNNTQPEGTSPRTVNWKLAREQQVRSLCFTIPFGMIVMATLYCWVSGPFTSKSYALVFVCWIVGYMLIRPWWIATVIAIQRNLVKTGEASPEQAPLHNKRFGQAMRHYFNWGLQQTGKKRRVFIGILRFLNPFIGLFQLQWLRVRLIRPLVVCAFYALLWPVTLPIAVFYLNSEFDNRDRTLKPKWVSSYAPEPRL